MDSRVTDMMKNHRVVRNLNRHQLMLDKIQNQLATGKKIRRPGDDPAAAANQMYFRTRFQELAQFEENVNEAKAKLNIVDGELGRITDILHRIRVLSVQAANGIYQGDNFFELRKVIASEIDQHLRALIDIANARDGTGRYLFGGHISERPPFEAIQSSLPLLKEIGSEEQIIGVRYQGDIGLQLREVERSQYIGVNLLGNKAFWGTNMTITGDTDTSGYQASSDQSFKIDGVEVRVATGDTIDDIIDKINSSGLDLKASKIGSNFLSLHTSSPHQIWLEDSEDGTVLKDIGLLSANPLSPPNNYAETARVSGLSLFDVVIKLRNDLFSGDQLEIGGRDLGNIDESMNNLLAHRASVGAKEKRLEEHEKRIAWDEAYMNELLAKSEGIDIPETIVNLKWLETVHNYALNTGARIIRPQLMD